MPLEGLSLPAANFTGAVLAFAGDGKRNAKRATEPKTFVFKNEICGVTFKWFPLGFDRNFGQEIGRQTYNAPPAFCVLAATPVAQSDNGGWAERQCVCDELRETADLRAAHVRLDLHRAHAGPCEAEVNY